MVFENGCWSGPAPCCVIGLIWRNRNVSSHVKQMPWSLGLNYRRGRYNHGLFTETRSLIQGRRIKPFKVVMTQTRCPPLGWDGHARQQLATVLLMAWCQLGGQQAKWRPSVDKLTTDCYKKVCVVTGHALRTSNRIGHLRWVNVRNTASADIHIRDVLTWDNYYLRNNNE